MELTSAEFVYLGLCLEWFFFGKISVNSQAQVPVSLSHPRTLFRNIRNILTSAWITTKH